MSCLVTPASFLPRLSSQDAKSSGIPKTRGAKHVRGAFSLQTGSLFCHDLRHCRVPRRRQTYFSREARCSDLRSSLSRQMGWVQLETELALHWSTLEEMDNGAKSWDWLWQCGQEFWVTISRFSSWDLIDQLTNIHWPQGCQVIWPALLVGDEWAIVTPDSLGFIARCWLS